MRNNIHILVIEDNPMDLDLLMEMISHTTYASASIHPAPTLKDGLKHLAEAQTDLVLLDLSLPDGLGIDNLHKIHKRFPQLPVIILTGLSDHEAAIEAIQAGAQDFMEKDRLESYALEKTIRYALERHQLVLSERKSREALQESNERFLSIFSQAAVGIAQASLTGQFLDVNDHMCRIFGYNKGELMNLSAMDLVHPEEKPSDKANLIGAGRGSKKAFRLSRRHIHKKGNIVYVNLFANKVMPAGGEPYFVLVYSDVTRRIEAENNLVMALSHGQEKERKRIAQELHDGLGQVLSGLKMYLQLSDAIRNSDELFNNLRQLMEDAITEYRHVCHQLLPPRLEESGLIDALEEYLERIRSTGKLDIRFTWQGEHDEVNRQFKTELFRIVQEIIQNTGKHAKARQVDIKLRLLESKIVLKVSDDGIGFDPAMVLNENRHIGLKNLRSRVKSMKGKVSIRSGHGKGTSISIEIPT